MSPQRIAVLREQDLSERQRVVWDAIAAGPRGGVNGPLNVWLHSPELAERAQALGAFCRYFTSLPARLSELAILCTAVHWRAKYEWFAHSEIALKAGLAASVIEALRTGRTPSFTHDDEAAVHGFATALLSTRQVPTPTYCRAVDLLGEVGVVELTGVLGYYGLISMTLNVFDVQIPTDVPDPFPS